MSDSWWYQHDGELVVWQGRPRLSAALPDISVGSAIFVLALVGAFSVDLWLLGGVPVGVAVLGWGLLRVRRTQYLLTTRAVWAKRGVLGRTVRRVHVDKIQNTSFSQSVTGSFFGYGKVSVEVAGGRDLEFRRVDNPKNVQTTLAEYMGSEEYAIPGSREQWESVLSLVREIRATVAPTRDASEPVTRE
jgi:uncharacterized membrane protein YdbT with pleckstrin-like domain